MITIHAKVIHQPILLVKALFVKVKVLIPEALEQSLKWNPEILVIWSVLFIEFLLVSLCGSTVLWPIFFPPWPQHIQNMDWMYQLHFCWTILKEKMVAFNVLSLIRAFVHVKFFPARLCLHMQFMCVTHAIFLLLVISKGKAFSLSYGMYKYWFLDFVY